MRALVQHQFNTLGKRIEAVIQRRGDPLPILRRIAIIRIGHGILVGSVAEKDYLGPILIQPILSLLTHLLGHVDNLLERVVNGNPDLAVDTFTFAENDLADHAITA